MDGEKNLVLTVDELMTELRVSRPVAYNLANRADFPAIRVGRRILVPRDGLERWLKAHEGKAV